MNAPPLTDPPTTAPLAYEQILDLLMCPQCAGQLEAGADQVSCAGCGENYPVRDGVPLLARIGVSGDWDPRNTNQTPLADYEQEYQTLDGAAAYNAAYQEKLFKRMSTAREFQLLRRLLGSQGKSDAILDLPCGGGRLSPQIAPHTKLLIEADIGLGQILYGKQAPPLAAPQIWMTASAFHIPLRDASVDGTVCCRLNHHMPTARERERLMSELLRVSRRFVVMTFFDYHSVKNRLRRARKFIDHKPDKMTMTVARVRELAAEHGARLVKYPMLAALSSGHRYALMVKES